MIDAVSDGMTNAGQTPYFIAQAGFTEVFSTITPALKSDLSPMIAIDNFEIEINDKGEIEMLLDLVEKDAARYATYDEAKSAIDNLALAIANANFESKLEKFYEKEVTISEKNSYSLRGIGNWLEQDSSGEQYFAEPTYKTKQRTRRIPVSGFSSSLYMLGGRKNDYEEVQESYKELDGFQHTVDLPYKFISFAAKELYPNIDPARCLIVPIISKTTMRVFWGWYFYDYLDWEKKKARSSIEWETATFPLKETSDAFAQKIITEFSRALEDALLSKWKSDGGRK